MDQLDFQPTDVLADQRVTRRVRAGAPAPDFHQPDTAAPPCPAAPNTGRKVALGLALPFVFAGAVALVCHFVRT
jgi:hypothetical protein